MNSTNSIPNLTLARKGLQAHLTQLYQTPWFWKGGERCPLAALVFLTELKSHSGLAAVCFLDMLRNGGVSKAETYELMEVLMQRKTFRLREWQKATEQVYMNTLQDRVLNQILQKSSDVLAVVGDPRFDKLPTSAYQVYAAASRLLAASSCGGMLATTLVKLAVEARVTKQTVTVALKQLVEAGVIAWHPGHKNSPSLLDFLPLPIDASDSGLSYTPLSD